MTHSCRSCCRNQCDFLIVSHCFSNLWTTNYHCRNSFWNIVLSKYFLCNILTSDRSEEHTSELQSRPHLVCRLLLEKKKKKKKLNLHKLISITNTIFYHYS